MRAHVGISIEDDLERARRWYVRCRHAFAGSSAIVGWGYEVSGVQRGGTRTSSFATSVEQLERFAERFRHVQVDHLDWRAVLERYDGPAAAGVAPAHCHPHVLCHTFATLYLQRRAHDFAALTKL